MLKKISSRWYVFSEKAGKNLGGYRIKKETAAVRLKQVEFFKHLKQTKGIKEGRKGRNR